MTTTLLALRFTSATNNYVGTITQEKGSSSLAARLSIELKGRAVVSTPFYDSWLPANEPNALATLTRRLRNAAKRRGYVETR